MLIGASPERPPTGESLSLGRVANCVPGYPADIRKVIYTTNAVESPNLSPRKVIKTRGSFPNQEAAMKLRYLALEHIATVEHPVQNRKAALQRFAILLGPLCEHPEALYAEIIRHPLTSALLSES